MRYPSSTDQKAAGYIDVNLGAKTWKSVYRVGKTTEVNEIIQGECRLRGASSLLNTII